MLIDSRLVNIYIYIYIYIYMGVLTFGQIQVHLKSISKDERILSFACLKPFDLH